jgi:hypothetical protein
MPEEQKVSPSEILASAGAEAPVTRGTFLQRTGLILAGCVGALGSIVILLLVWKWMSSAPAPPVIPVVADANAAKAILDNYKTLQQITLEPYINLFDSVVVKVLLPVFTSILGYIFGSRTSGKEE